MNKWWMAILVIQAACIGWPTPSLGEAPAKPGAFVLISPDLHDHKPIPNTFVLNAYGCTGGNISPALEWRGVPPGTKSFAITMFDPDEHGTPSGWWHWIVYDIPANITDLPQGAGAEKSHTLPPGAVQGRNDDSLDAYVGPCPDKGDAPHRYILTIYALSVAKLPVPQEASGANVTSTAHDYILGKATLVPVYGR